VTKGGEGTEGGGGKGPVEEMGRYRDMGREKEMELLKNTFARICKSNYTSTVRAQSDYAPCKTEGNLKSSLEI
jgi:hypothetical protein